jgi:hypothetical protein
VAGSCVSLEPLAVRANSQVNDSVANAGNLLAQAEKGPPREPRAYTPKHLADKILQSTFALEGERKQR